VKFSALRRLFGIGPSSSDVLRAVLNDAKVNATVSKLHEINDPRLPQALLNLEDKQTVRGFKFGVMYVKEGQNKEDELFANGTCTSRRHCLLL
jgi:RAP1 GTPase activating protein 1